MKIIKNGHWKLTEMFRFIPIDKLNLKIKYEIVGIPKCGTSSLAEYMRNKNFDVQESELDFLNYEFALNHDYNYRTPIIVTRNRIERTWSDYNFFQRDSLYDATRFSFYKAGLQMWDALIYSLEYLKTLLDFPHENIGNSKPLLTNSIKQEIIMELNR